MEGLGEGDWRPKAYVERVALDLPRAGSGGQWRWGTGERGDGSNISIGRKQSTRSM